jgi:ketosteroid isomerase-like protein
MRLAMVASLALAMAGPLAGQDATGALLAADRRASEASGACGFACGLGTVLAADAIYLHAGMPIIQGTEAATRFLRAQAPLVPLRTQWQPLHAELAADGTFGITWGLTAVGIRGGPVRFGHYLSAWRRTGEGWRLVGHVQTALNRPGEVVQPTGWSLPSLPRLDDGGPLGPLVEADRAFSVQAGREGAGAAFASWAAPDAVTFSGTGELVRGPDAIGASLSGGAPSHWTWGPVAVLGADDGSLGATIGEATITVDQAGGTAAVFRSKYLTAWRRGMDGTVRFIADAGNARPAP